MCNPKKDPVSKSNFYCFVSLIYIYIYTIGFKTYWHVAFKFTDGFTQHGTALKDCCVGSLSVSLIQSITSGELPALFMPFSHKSAAEEDKDNFIECQNIFE